MSPQDQLRRGVFLPLYFTVISLMVRNTTEISVIYLVLLRFPCLSGQPGVFTQNPPGTDLSSLTTKPGNRRWQVGRGRGCKAYTPVMYFSSSPHGPFLPAILPTLGQCQDPPAARSSLRLPLCPSDSGSGQTEQSRTANCHLQDQMEYQVTQPTPHS